MFARIFTLNHEISLSLFLSLSYKLVLDPISIPRSARDGAPFKFDFALISNIGSTDSLLFRPMYNCKSNKRVPSAVCTRNVRTNVQRVTCNRRRIGREKRRSTRRLNQPTMRRINGTETRSGHVRFMWRIIFFDVYTWPVGGVFIGRGDVSHRCPFDGHNARRFDRISCIFLGNQRQPSK